MLRESIKMITLSNLSKLFEGKKVLHGINLEINYGANLAIAGKNGSGKTTILKVVAGILKEDFGTCNIDQIKKRKRVVYISSRENSFFSNLTVKQNLNFFSSLSGTEQNKSLELIRMFGMNDKLNSSFSKLSTGEKKKMSIIRGLTMSPDIIILDECSNSLDHETTHLLRNELSRKRKIDKEFTIIQATHNLNDIKEFSDTGVYLKDGKLSKIHNLHDPVEEETFFKIVENPNEI